MNKFVHVLITVRDLVGNWLAYISAGLLAVMCFLISYDVIMRYFFNSPTDWASGIAEWILLFATWGGAAFLLKEKGHTVIDIVVERLSPEGRAVAGFISSVVGSVTCAFLFWASLSDCVESISFNSKVYLQFGYVARWLVLGIIPVGSLWLFFYFARGAVEGLTTAKRSGKTESDRQGSGIEPGSMRP